MLRIGIQLDLIGAFGRDVLNGIMHFANRAGDWDFVLPPMYARTRKPGITPHSVDGLLTMVHSPSPYQHFRRAGVPVVNVARTLDEDRLIRLRIPSVLADDDAIGRVAFEHFSNLGFRSFGFCGHPSVGWSRCRERAFARCAHENKMSFTRVEAVDSVPIAWVRSLQLPIAILAANDRYAWHMVDACRALKIRVPEDVAVLGVDNDVLLTELSRPTLSSIRPAARAIGIEAGRMLEHLMKGKRVSPQPLSIPPEGIVTRHSTDVLVMDDAAVVEAVRFIREQASSPISITDVLNAVPLSRRTLERRFQASLGRSMLDEIRRVKLERATMLLRDTDMEIPKVADQCGFVSHSRFSTVFRQRVGLTPTGYRRQSKLGRLGGSPRDEPAKQVRA